jgi:RNA polymerase sigma-70 factor, ECF subfamily
LIRDCGKDEGSEEWHYTAPNDSWGSTIFLRRLGRHFRLSKKKEDAMLRTSAADMKADADWRSGDAAAFEKLVRRWQQPVARFLFHFVGREELVADLCQEVFLRVYEHRGRYRETGAFAAWLYRIALNVARDAQRRRRQPECLGDIEPIAADLSPPDACAQAERGRLIAHTVAQLPEPLRIVLVLRHYEDMSFEQIARLLDTPASTIKSRFSVALHRLRERLQSLGDEFREFES